MHRDSTDPCSASGRSSHDRPVHQAITPKFSFLFVVHLDDYSRSAGGYHEHRAVGADNSSTCHYTLVLADGVTSIYGVVESTIINSPIL